MAAPGAGGLPRWPAADGVWSCVTAGKALGYYVEKSAPSLSVLESAATEVLLTMRDTLKRQIAHQKAMSG